MSGGDYIGNPNRIGNAGDYGGQACIIGNGAGFGGGVPSHLLGGAAHLQDSKSNLESKITGTPVLISSVASEFVAPAVPNKPAPVAADVLILEDSAAAGAKKNALIGALPFVPAGTVPAHLLGGGSHTADSKANLESKITGTPVLISSVAAEFVAPAVPNKAAPVAADVLILEDSAAAGAKKNALIGALPFVPAGTVPSFTTGFHATKVAANQALPIGAETLIDFDTDSDDPGGNFSTATDAFTAPATGRYTLSACATVVLAAAGYAELRLKRGAIVVATSGQEPNKPATCGLSLSATLKLTAGDLVRLYAFQNSAIAATINATNLMLSGGRFQ